MDEYSENKGKADTVQRRWAMKIKQGVGWLPRSAALSFFLYVKLNPYVWAEANLPP